MSGDYNSNMQGLLFKECSSCKELNTNPKILTCDICTAKGCSECQMKCETCQKSRCIKCLGSMHFMYTAKYLQNIEIS